MKWHYAATAKAVIFLTFDYCTTFLKAVSFIDLNLLGVCIAEKYQSDEKLEKQAELNHVVTSEINEEQCYRPQGKSQFPP